MKEVSAIALLYHKGPNDLLELVVMSCIPSLPFDVEDSALYENFSAIRLSCKRLKDLTDPYMKTFPSTRLLQVRPKELQVPVLVTLLSTISTACQEKAAAHISKIASHRKCLDLLAKSDKCVPYLVRLALKARSIRVRSSAIDAINALSHHSLVCQRLIIEPGIFELTRALHTRTFLRIFMQIAGAIFCVELLMIWTWLLFYPQHLPSDLKPWLPLSCGLGFSISGFLAASAEKRRRIMALRIAELELWDHYGTGVAGTSTHILLTIINIFLCVCALCFFQSLGKILVLLNFNLEATHVPDAV